MQARFGSDELDFPNEKMGELESSNHLLADFSALQVQMEKDGFLYLKGLVPREKVLQARQTILEHMESKQALTPDTPVLEGVMPAGGRSVQMMGRKGIATHPDVLAVLESQELFDFFERYFDEPALTFNYKWLRAVGNEQYTGAHMDHVYMGRGSKRLHTVWIPFGDIEVEQGTLAMCMGSNRLDGFEKIRQTYGRMDVDRDKVEGWFSREPLEIVEKFGGRWVTGRFAAGDVMIFGMHTMHASTTNLTNRFRLSCDVRFQPASELADKRWVGTGPGHTDHGVIKLKSMEDAREEWGV
ncbi:MAG: phytanoyl-CoA dioxygenase family protein [Chloroflexota bacterium]